MTTSDQLHTTFTSISRTLPQEISSHLVDDAFTHDHHNMVHENNSELELREEKVQEHATGVSQKRYIEQGSHMTRDYGPLVSSSTPSSTETLQSLRKRSSRILTEKERRINHSKSEQRRRQQLKAALSVLEQLIPDDISLDMNLLSELSRENNSLTNEQIQSLNVSIPSPSTEATIINRAVLYIQRLTLEQMALNTQVNQFAQRTRQPHCSNFQYQYPSGTFLNHAQSTPIQSHQISMNIPSINSSHQTSGSLESIAFVNPSFHNTNTYSMNTITIPFNNTNQHPSYNCHHQMAPRNVQLHHDIHETMDPSFHRRRELTLQSRDPTIE